MKLYVNIASPPVFGSSGVTYRDYELDVLKHPGSPAEVLDGDEFFAAIDRYYYDGALILRAVRAVQQAKRLVDGWTWRGARATQEFPPL